MISYLKTVDDVFDELVSCFHLFSSFSLCRNVFKSGLFPPAVKCVKSTPAYFAERLHHSLKVKPLV